MALTFTQLTPAALFFPTAGNLKEWIGEITGDTSYPSGGYSIPNTQAQTFGMQDIIGIDQIGVNTAGLLYYVTWNRQTRKLAFITAGAEASGNISTITVRVRIIGR